MPSLEVLRTVALFSQLRESDLERLGRIMREQNFPKKRVILFAHEPCNAFYVLLSGQVKVILVAEDGREVVLSLIHTGDFFGERTLLDQEPHAASVIATEDSRLLILHRDEFRRCIMEMPGVAFGLLRALLSRLRAADHRIGGLILLDVTGRVCHLLLQLADWSGGDEIPKPPTHQVIAQMIGSSRETVSRTIKTMVDQGFLAVSKEGAITIKNRPALEGPAGQFLRKGTVKEPRQERRASPILPPPPTQP